MLLALTAYYGYKLIRFSSAGFPEHITSLEMNFGEYVCIDYDYIVPTKVVAGYETYSVAKLKNKNEFVLILFDGMAVFYISGFEESFSDSTMYDMLSCEGILSDGSAKLPGTLYGIVEHGREELNPRFETAFEVISESSKDVKIVSNENIDLSYVVSFSSKSYYEDTIWLYLILTFFMAVIFIISCRFFATRKREIEINDEQKNIKRQIIDELVSSAKLTVQRKGIYQILILSGGVVINLCLEKM